MNNAKSFKAKRFKKKPKKFEIKVVSRKQQRKALRKEKKSKKFARKHVAETSYQTQKKAEGPVASCKSILKKPSSDSKKKIVRFKNSNEIQDDLRSREKQSRAQLEKDMAIARKKQLLQANEEEDRSISQLEKLLKLNKKKKKGIPKAFKADGLDYLLEICDVNYSKNSQPSIFESELGDTEGDKKEDQKSEKKKRKRKDEEDEAPEERSSKKPKKNKSQPEITTSNDGFNEDDFGENVDFDDDFESEGDTVELNNNSESDDDVAEFGSDIGQCSDISDIEDSQEFEEGQDASECGSDIPDMEEEFELKSGSDSGDDITKNDDDTEDLKGEFELKSGSDSDDDITEDNIDFSGDGSNSESETSRKAPKNKALELPGGKWEDIYGRLHDKKGNIIQEQTSGKYVPPAMRAKLAEVDKDKAAELMRLRKLMKGLINRLAEGNMASISKQIEDIYNTHSRNSTNEMLFKLFMEAVVAETLTPEKLIMEHAMLIAILSANVGVEVGAFFMQELIKKFDSLYVENLVIEDKRLDNLLYLLAHMYTFKIFHSCLLYGLVNQFCDKFSEKDIDLILVVLKSVGFSLRKDDPGALKQLILKIQLCASKETKVSEGSRVKFMIEVLLAVKNNNFAKIPGYDSSHAERLKKLVKGIIRAGKYISELKINLDDLRNADERGRWWIVGSAWTGTISSSNSGDNASKTGNDPQFSSKVLELARKQRMNTDTRRNVFCILMTAEDYLNAFEKLLHLGLKGSQEQEILRVVVHCLLQEKDFNLYYAYLAQHFCETDRKYQLNIQYTAWDKFKDLSAMSAVQISNFAKFLAHLFLSKAVPISILKVLHFTDLDQAGLKFLRQLLSIILLADSDDKVSDVFIRVSKSPKLKLFRESLRLFFHHFLLRNVSKLPDFTEKKLELLKRRITVAENAMTGSTDSFSF